MPGHPSMNCQLSFFTILIVILLLILIPFTSNERGWIKIRKKILSMSIATKTGDKGTTGLMYNRRVSKCHPRVEAYGCVDELNTAMGLARASAKDAFVTDKLLAIQQDLVILMGALATAVEDLARYVKDGYKLVTPGMTAVLDKWVAEIE